MKRPFSNLLTTEQWIAWSFLGLNALVFGVLTKRRYELYTGDGFEVLDALGSAALQTWTTEIKYIFVAASLFFIAFFLRAMIGRGRRLFARRLNPKPSPRFQAMLDKRRGVAKKDVMLIKHWDAIMKRAETGTPENLRLAVLEGDALVDSYLKKQNYPGETMGERLKNFSHDMKSLDDMWDAHKLRNQIAHTPNFSVSKEKAMRALKAFQRFLKELKAF